jgi:sugar phosphate isomerase/epimerase
MADDAGVAIIGAHIGVQQMREDLSAVIDRLHTWDCRYVAIPSAPGDERDKPGGWRKLATEFSRIGRKLAKEGITLQYHNHHFEFTKYGVRAGKGGQRGIDILYERSDPEALQAELDIGWVARAGADPLAYIRRLKGRLDQVHVKDWGIAGREPTWMPIGEGNLNWPPILKACRAAGTKFYIYEQDNCPTNKDPFQAARISLENMHELGLK